MTAYTLNPLKSFFRWGYKGVVVVLLLISLPACAVNGGSYQAPHASRGVMDLRQWDPGEKGSLKLDGEWEFYWNRLLAPQDFNQPGPLPHTTYFKVPQTWNGTIHNGKPLKGEGYATFRLKLIVEPKQEFYALKVTDLPTAYKIWVNGEIIMKNGVVGKNKAQMKPQFFPQTSIIRLLSGENTMVLQVSNFYHKKGGIWGSLILGSERAITRLRNQLMSFEIFLFGAFLVIGFYHLGTFFMRRKEVSALLFSGISFIIGIRVILTGERIIMLVFPTFSWEALQKAEYLTVYLINPLFYLFLTSLFPEFSRLMAKLAVLLGISFSLFTLLTPTRIFSHGILYFQWLIILYGIYMLITLFRTIRNNRDGSYWVGLGFVLLLSTVIHDILIANDVIDNIQLSPLGLFLFVFLQSFMLSIKLTKAFSSIERIYSELEDSNRTKDELLGALTISEKKYRDLLENIDEVLFTLDLEGRITYTSPSIEKITGFKPEHLMNSAGIDLIYREDLSEVLQSFQRTLDGFEQRLTCRMITKWESTRWVRFNFRPISEDDKIKELQGLMVDITEHKKARELMVQTEKMMSVGGLAAGMAHELNNPLGAIIQATQIVKRRLFSNQKKNREKAMRYSIDLPRLADYLKDQRVLHFLEGIQEAGMRAASIIENMLQFSRKSDSQMRQVNLVLLIDKTIELANNSYDLEKEIDFKQIEIIKEIESGLHNVPCSETEIRQVLLNLLINAAQALFTDKNNQSPTIRIRLKQEGEFTRLEVGDNGPGMDEKTRRRIFEPFFTTKKAGKGTGLGLSVSYMIITSNHAGAFEVESEIGKGTRFVIWLPKDHKVVQRSESQPVRESL